MSKLTIDGLLVCVIACAACTGDSTSNNTGTTTDPFVGRWSCMEEMSVTFTSPPGASPINETEMATISITGSGGALTASKETDSGSNCKLSITSSGSSASLSDGQTCTTKHGISLVYKSGSATVTGTMRMDSTFEFDASGTITVMGMMVDATANGTQKSNCSRITPPPSPTGGATTGGW